MAAIAINKLYRGVSVRLLLLSILTFLSLQALPANADAVVSSTNNILVLKRIVEKVGNRMRALVVDHDGHESQIYINSEDAVEIKRGLWMIRPGVYQSES